MFARLTLLLIALGIAAAAEAQELKPETRNYDVRHLKLDLRFDLKKARVEGTCSLTLAPLADGFQQLLLHSKDTIVLGVTVVPAAGEARPARRFRTGDGLLRIDLDAAQPKDQPFRVEIEYEATPTRGLYFFAPTPEHPEIPWQVWSQGEGTDNRHWYPCYDEPDDRFTSEILARIPRGFRFISNGKCVQEPSPAPAAAPAWGKSSVVDPPAEEDVWHFRFEHEHVNYLVSAIVGRFDRVEDRWEDVPLLYYVPPGRAPEARLAFGATADMMRFFCAYTGERYPYGTYTQTTVWDFMYGGMENTSVTTLNLRSLHDHRAHLDYQADGLVAHELAHMWFGDLLTCKDWSEMWLNEGFATYFTDLWVLDHHGPDRFACDLHGTFRNVAGASTHAARKDLKPEKEGQKKPLELPQGMNYTKGSLVLHMLRGVMGEERFRDGIRAYVARHRHGNVTSEDLRKSMEEVHGSDLAWFFDQWVYGAGYPEYFVTFDWADGRKEGTVRVRQVQPESPLCGLFRMPVQLAFWSGSDGQYRAQVERVWVEAREQSFTFSFPQRPAWVRFDAGEQVLKRLEFVRSQEELALQLQYDDVSGRLEAAEELARLGAVAVGTLRAARLRDPVAGVREGIVEALASVRCDDARDALLAALDDASSEVRTRAAEALGEYPGDKIGERLKQVLLLDESYYARGAAAKSLGRSKAAGAFEALVAALRWPSYREILRSGAVAGLLALGDPRATAEILPLLAYRYEAGGQHHLVRDALDGLARAGVRDRRVIERATALLGDPYFRTRAAAARALASLRATESLPALVDRWKNERNDEARGAIEEAIRNLGRATDPGPDPTGMTAADLRALADRRVAEARDLELDAELLELEAEKLRARADRLEPQPPHPAGPERDK